MSSDRNANGCEDGKYGRHSYANPDEISANQDGVDAFLAQSDLLRALTCARLPQPMPIAKPRSTLPQLLTDARRQLRMSQREFGPALGASHRTANRWDAGKASPAARNLQRLAELLAPVNPALATEAAAHIGQTLESLGLVSPSSEAGAAAQSGLAGPAKDLVDIVLCAAAEAADTSPRAMRSLLYVAFRRARQVGLTTEQLEQALAPEKEAKARSGRSARGGAG
ncbi:MAG: helix-turn-helix domain-containing protein [Polyangiaceae bacterium]